MKIVYTMGEKGMLKFYIVNGPRSVINQYELELLEICSE